MNSLAFGLPGNWEWIVLLVIGLLIFGPRLPHVGRSLGRSIVEFKRGIKGVEDEIEAASDAPSPKAIDAPSDSVTPEERAVSREQAPMPKPNEGV